MHHYTCNDNNICHYKLLLSKQRRTRIPLQNKVKDLRAIKKINQQELGTLAGVSRQTISLIERGDYNPSVTLAINLAKIFNVRVEDVFTIEEDKE